ncbi:MAG TPA: response regulator transcription factor, partial [Candidatus Methylomirabilis sp.]
ALDLARKLRPDVLLLDIAMPRMNGLDAVKLIHDAVPETGIVILSMYANEAYIHRVLEAGALGYTLKGAPSEEVLAAIWAVHEGKYYLSPQLQADVIEAYVKRRQKEVPGGGYELLSERERQVFRLLVEGNSTSQIASILCLGAKTAEKHRTNIVKKLGVSNPIDMVKYAVRIGILDPNFWKT